MSAKIIKCKTVDGRDIEFVDEIIGSGGDERCLFFT